MNKKSSQLIHVKLDYGEAREAKKDLLETELELVKLQRAMKSYKSLRIQELKEKQRLKTKLSTATLNLRKLKLSFPTLTIPDYLKEDFEEAKLEKETAKELEGFEETIEERYNDDLEMQLREIQERLREMGKK